MSERIPNLDKLDLETIVLLVREYGNKNIPLFSKRLMDKVKKSLEAYKNDEEGFKPFVNWPKGTEYLSNGPFTHEGDAG